MDEKLEHPWTITIYGSAAVAFYLADEDHQERAYTRDIDIGDMEPDQVEENFKSDIVDPPLHFQAYPFTQWLHHPDWSDAVVDLSDLIGTHTLIVRLLHPCDLIITKLERAADQDFEDALLLRERYIEEVSSVEKRVFDAAKYYAMSNRARRQIEYAFEGIFEHPIDLSGLT
ncbi:MAG: DUF6036 family nucleotidyltransferase [Persicimonas sp.]